jgi:tripartite ATP-independent transporter DctP family solute receptor
VAHSISRTRFAAGTAATLASINVLRLPAKAATFAYKYASNISIDHPLNVRMIQMWSAVKRETGGAVDVTVFPNNQLGGDTAMLTQLRSGALQFFTLDGGILQSVVPVAAIQAVGFAFKNSAEAFSAFDGALGAYVRTQIEAKGLVAFPKMWANGMRQITSSTHPIKGADDLANFKIRTPPGALWVDLFKSLGASPTPINFSEVYTALQNHTVDGQENPYAVIAAARLFEVQKYLSVTNHMWSAFWLLANPDAWKALPPDAQAVIERNAAKYAILQRADTDLRNESLADKLVRSGMQLNVADTAGFRARLGDFYKRWHATFGDTAWSLLEKTTGKIW